MAEAGAAWPFDDRTALVVVDMQNDFADRRGSLYVDGGEQMTEQVNRLVREARSAGQPVDQAQGARALADLRAAGVEVA